MKVTSTPAVVLLFCSIWFILGGCKTNDYSDITGLDRKPVIKPDYSGVTIPPNIAPVNFKILEPGELYKIKITPSGGAVLEMKSSDGKVCFQMKEWKRLLEGSRGGKLEIEIFTVDRDNKAKKYSPFYLYVATEPADPYICYRLTFLGYKLGNEMQIVQRCIEDFKEFPVFEDMMMKNCVNCHSFYRNNPDSFLLQIRGSQRGGTYFINNKKVVRRNLQTKNMPNNVSHPSWHPGGRFLAFSCNKTVQAFHMRPEKNIEVCDLSSSLVLYDIEKNNIIPCQDTASKKYMETFPNWSPAGDYLYYCRTDQINEDFDFMNIKYDIVRRSFNQESVEFGEPELVFNAREKNKSVSFPDISPDGKYMVFTLHDHGTLPSWREEADLYLLDLKKGKVDSMCINSNKAESYHSWSSNGNWLVFSSKIGDGLTARLYFAYFNSPDSIGKPFVLPQKDPTSYDRIEKTYNKPEFIKGRIKIGPRDFIPASEKEPVKSGWIDHYNQL